jgi:hypothetical protein
MLAFQIRGNILISTKSEIHEEIQGLEIMIEDKNIVPQTRIQMIATTETMTKIIAIVGTRGMITMVRAENTSEEVIGVTTKWMIEITREKATTTETQIIGDIAMTMEALGMRLDGIEMNQNITEMLDILIRGVMALHTRVNLLITQGDSCAPIFL